MIALYARQSVDKKDSISIEAQIQAGQRIAGDNLYKIYDNDKGFSGKNTDRPDYKRLVTDIKNGTINKVIVFKIDRISRSIVDFADIIQLFEKHKVEFVSVTENFDTSTPMGRAMLYIIMIFAQLERETIQERVRHNFYERMKVGIGKSGRPPFGFIKVPAVILGKNTKILQSKEDETELVKQIYYTYANTDITLHKLKVKLTQESDLKPFFTDTFLNCLLRNPIYVKANADVYTYLKSKGAIIENDIEDFVGTNGCFAYANAKERTTQRFTDLHKTHIAIQPHEGIIDSDTWLKCNYRLDKNKAFKNSGTGNYIWLAGLMKCAYCGYSVFATGNKPTTLKSPTEMYINCRGRRKHICYERTKAFTTTFIENLVSEMILEYLNQQKDVKLLEKEKKTNNKLDSLKNELSIIKMKIKNLMNSIADGNEILSKYANEKIKEFDIEQERLNAEITKEVMNSKEDDRLKNVDKDYIINNWVDLGFDDKKNIAKLVIKEIVVSNEGIDVEFF